MSRRVLVTGGAGFVGARVCAAYRDAGWSVVALDHLSTHGPGRVPDGVQLVEMDVRDDAVDGLVAEGGFSVVSHHAAQADVRASVRDPRGDASVNVDGTLNLLEACRRHGVGRFVFASSGGTVYGEPETLPVPEGHPKRPDAPYGIAKLAGEHYARFHHAAGGPACVSLRYANVYGPGQDPTGEAGVVAIFGRRLLAGEPLVVYGDGEQTRDFVHVDDVARANLLATRLELPDGPAGIDALAFNVGTARETTVNGLARRMMEAAGREVEVVHEEARPGELRRSALDASKLEARGWAPRVGLDEGLAGTLEHLAAES